ncbi:g9234 [Coccomyxa elongata]
MQQQAATSAPDGTFYTGDGRIVQKSSQGSVPPSAAAATSGSVGTEQAGATNTRSNPRVGSIDVDNTSRSALGQTSKAVASAPGASAGRRHLAQADIGAAAQQLLSAFANGGAQANQASASQGAGVAAQPLVSTVQSNNNMQSSGAAAADPSSGVVSGKTYQSSGQASPLTPYNQAMENSIGNVAQQMFSSFGKQTGTSLQQTNAAATATSDIPAANQFVQPQLPANRDIVSFNVPHPDLTAPLKSAAASALAGRKLQDAAGMSQTTPLAALKHLADTITEPTGPTALRSAQSMAANSGNTATSAGNTANFGDAASLGNAASFGSAASSGNAAGSGSFSAAATVPADYSSAYSASAITGQPASTAIYAGAVPFATSSGTGSSAGTFGASASDAGATAGYSAQPMAAQGMPSDSTNFNAGRGANAQQSLGGLTGMAINLLNGRRLQQVASSTLDNIAATVAKDTAVQAAAVSLVKAASAASGAYWTAAPKDTAAAMNVIQLSAADKATVAAATEMGSAVRTAALASFGSSLPTSLSTAASHLDFASLVQDPTVQSAAVPVLQAAAAAAGNSWNADALGLSGAAESTVASAVADPSTVTAARSLAQTIVSQSALTSFGTTLGNLFSGRRLHQADFGTIVNNVATDPAVQAAAVHVMEAANTEVAALHVLSAAGPASAPAPLPATNTLTALQQLVSSVSHNAIATALPFTAQQATSSSAPIDWEAMLAAPGNAAAAAAAAQKDASVVKKFDAAETGRAAAAQLQGAVAGLLSGAGGRRLAAAGDGQASGRVLQSDGEGLLPNLKNNMADTLSSLSTNARTAGENALIELGKHVVRTIGIDSNTQGFATPHSQYGYNPIAAVVPYGSSVNTATTDVPDTSVITNAGTVTASALNGVVTTPNEMGASATDAMPLAASQVVPADSSGSMQTAGYPAASQQMPSIAAQLPAAQAVLPSGAMSALGRRRLDEAAAQQTGPTLQAIVSTISDLASAVRTALSPSSAPQAENLQGQGSAGTQQVAQPGSNFQSVGNGYGGASYGGSSGGGGGNVGVTQATTYAGEGGKQISSNDIHLDNSASNFVIGPDGKVPSLASQGGAAAVAQSLGLLVPNGGTTASQSVPSPPSYPAYGSDTGYGQNTQQSPSYGYGQNTQQQSPSYGYGQNNQQNIQQSPGYGYGQNNQQNTQQSPSYGYGQNSQQSPGYGYGQNSQQSPSYGYGASNAASPSSVYGSGGGTGGASNTVTAYNTGQSYGAASTTSNNNNSGPTIQQGSSYAAPANSLETQSTTAFASAVPRNPSQQNWGTQAAATDTPAGNNGWQMPSNGAAVYQQQTPASG